MPSIKSIEGSLKEVRIDLPELDDAYLVIQEPYTLQMFELERISQKEDKLDSTYKWYENNMPSLIKEHNFEDAKDNREVVKALIKNYELFTAIIRGYSDFLVERHKFVAQSADSQPTTSEEK